MTKLRFANDRDKTYNINGSTGPSTSDSSKPSPTNKDASILMDALNRQQYPVHALYGPADGPMIPTEGPATEPDGPRTYTYIAAPNPAAFNLEAVPPPDQQPTNAPPDSASSSGHPPNDSSELHRSSQSPDASSTQGGVGANHYPSSSGVPRLPPILQVEKQQVTTSATQVASANRRRNEAHFQCPVPGCGSTFTRRFNLRGERMAWSVFQAALTCAAGHLRSHTEERPYVCQWPGCKKGFARQHDCKYVTCAMNVLLALRLTVCLDVTRPFTLPRRRPMSVKVARKHSADLMH